MNNQVKGLAASFGAYLCWGFMPLYWALFGHVRGWEVIGHRVLWSLLIISALLLLLGRLEVIKSTVRGVVRSKIQLFNLFMAAVLAAVNWWINVYSVSINQVVARHRYVSYAPDFRSTRRHLFPRDAFPT